MPHSYGSTDLKKRGGECSTAVVVIALMLSAFLAIISNASERRELISTLGWLKQQMIAQVQVRCLSLPTDEIVPNG